MCTEVCETGKQVIMVYLKVLTKDLPGETGEDHEEATFTDAQFETVKPDILRLHKTCCPII
jgi:hypothetical protein